MRLILLLATTAALCGTAAASGGIGCEGTAGPVTLTINSGVTRGMGSPVFQFTGSIKTTDKSIEPDLQAVELSEDNLAQYWLDATQLNMVIYRERVEGDHGYVHLTMMTKQGPADDDEGIYEGQFDVVYHELKGVTSGEGKTVRASGPVKCFVE